MADGGETKTCPLCAETIKAAAKVCPHCRKMQGGMHFISRYDLLAGINTIALAGIIIMGIQFFCFRQSYSPQQYKITVLESQFAAERSGKETNIVVSGVLTNESDYTWNLTEFEIRLLDVAGKTVDARHGGSDYERLTVMPHSDRSFKLVLYPGTPLPEHASQKITVTGAIQPGFWLNND